ncbi:hypothetical protein L218DRAFT_261562 [Marasmius fiardii PR-910]|nr:hypothetical protein L218DRAFT_261562 [Marasmius fiardii PR-910]
MLSFISLSLSFLLSFCYRCLPCLLSEMLICLTNTTQNPNPGVHTIKTTFLTLMSQSGRSHSQFVNSHSAGSNPLFARSHSLTSNLAPATSTWHAFLSHSHFRRS